MRERPPTWLLAATTVQCSLSWLWPCRVTAWIEPVRGPLRVARPGPSIPLRLTRRTRARRASLLAEGRGEIKRVPIKIAVSPGNSTHYLHRSSSLPSLPPPSWSNAVHIHATAAVSSPGFVFTLSILLRFVVANSGVWAAIPSAPASTCYWLIS